MIELNSENFAQARKAYPMMLVNFYAPWCGHCLQLAPEFEKAAQAMLDRVVFAKVDATLEVQLANDYKIEGYPTLHFFRDGEPEDYLGGKTNASIVQWVEERFLPPLVEVATEIDLKKLMLDRRSTSYFVARGNELKEVFSKLAEENLLMGVFIFVVNATRTSVNVHRGVDEELALTDEAQLADADKIYNFLLQEALPPFGQITEDNFEAYVSLAREGLLWVCFHPGRTAREAIAWDDVFQAVAASFQQFRRLH